MKYIKRHPLLLEDKNWLVSMKDDIIECSYELTDLPYNFYHCGRLKDENSIDNYLRVNGNRKYLIAYLGSVEVPSDDDDWNPTHWTGYVSGSWDGSIKGVESPNEDLDNSDKVDFRGIVDDILPALEDVLVKLRGYVFTDELASFQKGDWNVTFSIYCYRSARLVDGRNNTIMISVKIIFNI